MVNTLLKKLDPHQLVIVRYRTRPWPMVAATTAGFALGVITGIIMSFTQEDMHFDWPGQAAETTKKAGKKIRQTVTDIRPGLSESSD